MSKVRNIIHLIVPVEVSEDFALTNELPDYLKKFVEIGFAKLKEDVEENLGAACSFIDEDDGLIATQTNWNQPWVHQLGGNDNGR